MQWRETATLPGYRAIAISTSIGAQTGLLVKDRLALERARNLDMVIFDKTGTLTRGSPALTGVATAPGGN
jgi:P-type Cu2+ transporter